MHCASYVNAILNKLVLTTGSSSATFEGVLTTPIFRWETEAQRGEMTCVASQSWNPGGLATESAALSPGRPRCHRHGASTGGKDKTKNNAGAQCSREGGGVQAYCEETGCRWMGRPARRRPGPWGSDWWILPVCSQFCWPL